MSEKFIFQNQLVEQFLSEKIAPNLNVKPNLFKSKPSSISLEKVKSMNAENLVIEFSQYRPQCVVYNTSNNTYNNQLNCENSSSIKVSKFLIENCEYKCYLYYYLHKNDIEFVKFKDFKFFDGLFFDFSSIYVSILIKILRIFQKGENIASDDSVLKADLKDLKFDFYLDIVNLDMNLLFVIMRDFFDCFEEIENRINFIDIRQEKDINKSKIPMSIYFPINNEENEREIFLSRIKY